MDHHKPSYDVYKPHRIIDWVLDASIWVGIGALALGYAVFLSVSCAS
jgi:hypothetical protein